MCVCVIATAVCRLFLRAVWLSFYFIFLLLCQSCDCGGGCDWLGDTQERRESWDGWPEGGYSHREGEEGRRGCLMSKAKQPTNSNVHFQQGMQITGIDLEWGKKGLTKGKQGCIAILGLG